mgnify:FL=1
MAAQLLVNLRTALGRIGFPAPAREALVAQGISSVEDLTMMSEKDIDAMMKHMSQWRGPGAGAAAAQVQMPFLAVLKLKVMREWVLERQRLGLTTNVNLFTVVVCTEMMTRLKNNKDQKRARDDIVVTKLIVLKDMTKAWTKFSELLVTYLGCTIGAAEIPLTYLLREHADVTPNIQDADYDNDEDHLVATTVLTGPHFTIDNTTLYEELKPLVINGAGWSFIKQFDRTKNGREAFLALKNQAEGQSAKLTRKTEAYATLKAATYRGRNGPNTFQHYVEIFQEAFNELADLDEPVPESKKVSDFLAGISDPILKTGKDVVLGDPVKLADFTECQQYLSTLAVNTNNQSKLNKDRNASAFERHDDGGDGKKPCLDGRKIPWEQFKKLSQADKDLVVQRRKAIDKNAKRQIKAAKTAKKAKAARKAAAAARAAASDSEEESDDETEEPMKNAGDQFGRRAHKGKTK